MEILKIKSQKTYKNKDGKEVHYYNYALQLDNGKRIIIKCAFKRDYVALNYLCKVVK